jgi:hypothetical protein
LSADVKPQLFIDLSAPCHQIWGLPDYLRDKKTTAGSNKQKEEIEREV